MDGYEGSFDPHENGEKSLFIYIITSKYILIIIYNKINIWYVKYLTKIKFI